MLIISMSKDVYILNAKYRQIHGQLTGIRTNVKRALEDVHKSAKFLMIYWHEVSWTMTNRSATFSKWQYSLHIPQMNITDMQYLHYIITPSTVTNGPFR